MHLFNGINIATFVSYVEMGLQRKGPCKGTAFFLFLFLSFSHIYFLVRLTMFVFFRVYSKIISIIHIHVSVLFQVFPIQVITEY